MYSFHRRLAFALALSLGSASAADADTAAASPTTAPFAKIVATIHIKDFKYEPTPTHVRVGDRVRFINDDDEAHTVTSTDKSFDSEGLDTGNSWDHVFTKPGTYAYFCELHPYMKGIVMVSK